MKRRFNKGRPVPLLTAFPQGPMVNQFKPRATFYVSPRAVISKTGQLDPAAMMVNKPAGTAQVPVVWNGYYFEAKITT